MVNLSPHKNREEINKIACFIKTLVDGEEGENKDKLKLEHVKVLINLTTKLDDGDEIKNLIKILEEYSNINNEFKLVYARGLNNYYFSIKKNNRDKILKELEKIVSIKNMDNEVKNLYVRVLGEVPSDYNKNQIKIVTEKVRKMYIKDKRNILFKEYYVKLLAKLSILGEVKESKDIFNILNEIVEEDEDNEIIIESYLCSNTYLFINSSKEEQKGLYDIIKNIICKKSLRFNYIDLLINMLNGGNIHISGGIIQLIELYIQYNNVTEEINILYAEALKNILRFLKDKKEREFARQKLKDFTDLYNNNIQFRGFYVKGLVNIITNPENAFEINKFIHLLENEISNNTNDQMLEDYVRGISNSLVHLSIIDQNREIDKIEEIINRNDSYNLKCIYAVALFNLANLRSKQDNEVVSEKLRKLMENNKNDKQIVKICLQTFEHMK
ncbi:hypothetical protein [Clostridium botulinum]|uniref:hypothetical protein n=1 Tax=Clostridium botulinum TaxID=1491 RepID=UPI0003750E98|nr:hypothetical protein [Clostridium botulinum]